ncbi:MAG TPA: DeoR family transcriptional regulator, partial [Abditibacteriaceae bacterium]|nr:DeoR family transcriptional regulator [Abditibacteriaceae bacterium]
MLREHRFHKIEDALSQKPFLEVKALARLLRVSDATVRRDLEALDRAGRLARTRGGAMLRRAEAPSAANGSTPHAATTDADNLDHVASFAQRSNLHAAAKARIGKAAAGLIGD